MGYFEDAQKRARNKGYADDTIRTSSYFNDAAERAKKREEEEKRALVQSDPAGLRELTSYDTFQKQRQLAEAKNNTAIQRQEEAQKQNAEKAYLDNKARLDALNQLKKDTMSATLTASQTRNPNLVNKTLADAGFSSMRDLTDEISKRTQEYNLATAQREKDEAKASALSAPDFAQYSEMGKSFGNNVSTERNGTFDIGNKVTFSKENPEMVQRMKASGINLGDERYSNMTDEEVNIYSYYLAKEKAGLLPEGTADNYLYTIDADLNARQGAQIAEKHEDSLATELLFGISAGLDQHYSGLANLGNALGLNNKPQTPSAIALASQQIRDSLSEKSKVAQFAYDAVTTTSNMLPSILASTLTSGGLGLADGVARTVGAVSMGTGAAGNAYNEMKNLGYDDGSARTYALITGLSETLLQEALGGIPGVGSVLTDKGIEKFASGLNNAAAKFALRMGANAYAEGMEEFLQDVLNPYFKAFATGEHAEDIDWEEAIYSGLLGAASSILMGGPAYISNAIDTQRTLGPEQQAIIDEGLASEEGTQSRAIAEAYQKKVESGKNLNALELQNLYEANVEAINAENAKTTSDNAEYVKKYFANLNYNEDVVKGMAEAYDSVTSDSVTEYSNAMETAFNYGKVGMSADTLAKANLPLTDAQKKIAYNLGSMERIKADAEASAKVVKADVSKLRKGAEVYLHGIDENTFSERQKASFDAVKNVVSNITNLPIHFYESEANENGERVYKSNIPGTEVIKGQKAPNGFYDRPSDAIYLDINAGNNGEGTILWTLAHELTHSISYKNRDNFRKLASAVFDALGNAGADIEKLAYNQMAKSERAGHSIDFDTAIEEVVSDAMSEVFTRDGGIEAFAQNIKKADKTLWQKIKEFFKGLAARITKAYQGLDAQSKEAEYMRKVTEGIDKINRLFAEGLVEVGQNEVVSTNTELASDGIMVADKTDSGSIMSVRNVLDDKQRTKVVKNLMARFGVTEFEATHWLDAETSLASLILNPKYSQYLDYVADDSQEAIKLNADYPQGTVDFSNICAKRREMTTIMNAILRQYPDHVFLATDLAKIRTIMQEEGMTVPCGICYVEDRRQLDTIVGQNFLDSLELYRNGSKTRPDGEPFNGNQRKAFALIKGEDYTPDIYELVTLEGRNKLKEEHPAMEQAWVTFNNARGMQAVRLLLNDAEYKRQILKYDKRTVKSKNNNGGLRIYSFSDMEMFHLIDIVQVLTDAASVGLSVQGYTKVNEYAKAVRNTGEKLNRSLIPAGEYGFHMEGNKVVLDYDTTEGIDINHPDFFDNSRYDNIGNILIGINDKQIRAAMVNKFVDQIIPFHTGQSAEVLEEKNIGTWENYKDYQTEKDLETGKTAEKAVNIYTDVIQVLENEGREVNKYSFTEKYLEVCKERNLKPKFAQFLNTDNDGNYVYTEGYYKLLVDFKTFRQNDEGTYLPQMPVKPVFDNAYMTEIMKQYVKDQKVKDAKIAKQTPAVLDRISKEIVEPRRNTLFSDRDSEYLAKSTQKYGDVESAAVEHFGTTKDFRVGGYILRDGTMLDFSGAHWLEGESPAYIASWKKNNDIRQVDHEDIYEAFEISSGKSAGDNRKEFINRGNIRMSPEAPGINIASEPTAEQYQVIRELIKDNPYNASGFYVDIEDKTKRVDKIVYSGSVNADKVVNDIKYYFANGKVREQSELSAFYSDRDLAPTFYSKMSEVIGDIKLDKMGANGVVPYLKGKGVKDEEIKWSGIATFLEGKKSVTKAELQEFAKNSMLKIEEETLKDSKEQAVDRFFNAVSEYYDFDYAFLQSNSLITMMTFRMRNGIMRLISFLKRGKLTIPISIIF